MDTIALHVVHVLADGTERPLRFGGATKFAALVAFSTWALPQMASAPPDLCAWQGVVQVALHRPRLMIELAPEDADTVPQRWRITVVSRLANETRSFPDDADGRGATMRCLAAFLLEDEGPEWGA